jgi:type II secretory pathway pseudopilin PulG
MPSTSIHKNREGFTLVEFLMLLVLLAILSVLSIDTISNRLNEERYDLTVSRLKQIRTALVGETNLLFGQHRNSFGYLGDVGGIPSAAQGLGALIANPGVPVAGWSVNSSVRIGMGWNGPYLKSDDSSANFTTDGWGNAFVYSPTASPPTVASLGADRAVGGTGYNQDITMELPVNTLLANVQGFIVKSGAQWSGNAAIELNQPSGSGVLQQQETTITSTANGLFSFSNVPMGVRSATVYIPSKAAPTQTIGPVVFTVDQPYVLIQANVFDVSPNSTGPTNLEVPIEMIDYGISSATVNLLTAYERSRTSLNTANYDGTVSYYFEIVGTNQSALAIGVTIVNTAGVTVGTLYIPAGTVNPTRIRTSFTPTTGAGDYRVGLPLTLLANQVTITEARMIVDQVGATKTSVYVPLIADTYNNVSNSDVASVDTTTSTTYSQPTPVKYSIWRKEDSYLSLSSGNPFTLEVNLAGGLAGNANAALFNRTTGLAVAGASVTSSGIGYGLQTVSFADTATNFADASDYELRISTSNAAQTAYVVKAGLWIALANLGTGEVFYRVGRGYTGSTSAVTLDSQRAFISTANFRNPTAYAEGVGLSSSSTGTVLSLVDSGTNDSGTTGSTVTGSALTWGTAKSRQRSSSALTLTAGDRFFDTIQTSALQISNVNSGTVVMQFHY